MGEFEQRRNIPTNWHMCRRRGTEGGADKSCWEVTATTQVTGNSSMGWGGQWSPPDIGHLARSYKVSCSKREGY